MKRVFIKLRELKTRVMRIFPSPYVHAFIRVNFGIGFTDLVETFFYIIEDMSVLIITVFTDIHIGGTVCEN